MEFARITFKTALYVCVFLTLSRAAVLENVKQEVEEIFQKLSALDEKELEVRQTPTCALPTVEYGSFECKNQLGQTVATPGNGHRCTLTCDAAPYVASPVDPVITCSAYRSFFGTTTEWDKTPSCKKYNVMHLKSPSGNNMLTYDAAKALCESKGTRLATYSELVNEYYAGLELCSCGYIQAEPRINLGRPIAMYPMRSWQYSCGDQGINVCSSGEKYNAWCHNYVSTTKRRG